MPEMASSAGTIQPTAVRSLRTTVPWASMRTTPAHSAASPISSRPATRLAALCAEAVFAWATSPAIANPLTVQPRAVRTIGLATTASQSMEMASASRAAYRDCRA